MTKSLMFILIGLGILTASALAGSSQGLKITASICKEVEEREPVGKGESFPPDVGKLYCHNLVEGAEDSTTVTHIWYYGEEEMAKVDLPVRSSHWRTWSSKVILPQWKGWWRVDILSVQGDTLTSLYFVIK